MHRSKQGFFDTKNRQSNLKFSVTINLSYFRILPTLILGGRNHMFNCVFCSVNTGRSIYVLYRAVSVFFY